MKLPRGKYIGESVDPVTDESDHFYRCKACGAWVDMRDLGMVLDHEGPLPHPTEESPGLACDLSR